VLEGACLACGLPKRELDAKTKAFVEQLKAECRFSDRNLDIEPRNAPKMTDEQRALQRARYAELRRLGASTGKAGSASCSPPAYERMEAELTR
jgi:hypothetical protein